MRIEMEGLNKPEDDKNAGVLNPEQSLGTDLTRKERRLLEKEKIKGMGLKKKLEYIWMYYKPAMAGVLALIVAAKLGADWYHNLQIETVLAISVVDAYNIEQETVSDKVKEILGYDLDDEYSSVDVLANLTTENGGTEFSYQAQMVYMAQIQASGVDVLIFPETLYEKAGANELFIDLEETLDEDMKAVLGDRLKGDYIAFGKETSLDEDFSVYYEPICLGIPVNGDNQENALKWLASVIAE